ncbi:MAG: hypothetical protein FJ098_00710 [Deltaproteobacteria bacterium]|nr:hypothetical protein [Deltaproteobacteria bacterium]
MRTRYNWYLGQLVGEADLDALEDGIEATEYNLKTGMGLAQQSSTMVPGPAEFGGITYGLTVTWDAVNKLLGVSIGEATDDQGRCIEIPASTVKVTNAGVTTVGDSSDATGDGALITSSCPAGQRIILSLFAVYDELLSDPRVDAGSSTVYFQIDESFKFSLEISTSFAHPPGVTPSRAATANGKVLLADVVLTNNAGTMEAVAGGICTTYKDWDDLGGTYANLTGRRSDWFAADEDPTKYPRFDAEGISLRRGTARGVLAQILEDLQRDTAGTRPPATSLIGSPAMAGAGAVYQAFTPKALSAGDLSAALLALLDAVNEKAARGGDTIQPVAGFSGWIMDPANLNATKALIDIKNLLAASVSQFMIGRKYGQLSLPNMLVEPFLYTNTPAGGGAWDGGDKWGKRHVVGTGVLQIMGPAVGPGTPYMGGIARLATAGLLNDHVQLILGYDPGLSLYSAFFDPSQVPFVAFSVRFRVSSITDVRFGMGLKNTGATSGAYVSFDSSVDAKIRGVIAGIGATTDFDVLAAPDLVANRWYTVRGTITGDGAASFQIQSQFGTGSWVDLNIAPDAFDPAGFVFLIEINNSAGAGAQKNIYIDQVIVGEAQLNADAV